jgi:NTE family protein
VTGGRAALVLGSGGARAAYEVGVARFLFEELHAALGKPPDLGILCGTSAGALNASALAAFARRPLEGVALLARRWTEMRLDHMVRIDRCEVLRLVRALLGHPSARAAGSLLESAARCSTWRTTRSPSRASRRIWPTAASRRWRWGPPRWPPAATGSSCAGAGRGPLDPSMVEVRAGELRPEHALASAAIPLLFPAVDLEGALYCDGSLRQSVPLSPAHHLGADRIVAVTTQHLSPEVSPRLAQARTRSTGSPVYALGKVINALHVDRMDEDLDRLGLVNDLLAAGQRAFGGDFLERLNRELRPRGARSGRCARCWCGRRRAWGGWPRTT